MLSTTRPAHRSALRPVARPASRLALALLASALLVGGALAQEAVTVELKDVDGKSVGEATLTPLPAGGVLIDANLTALPPGVHGFHLHETGSCDAADGFKSAGDHIAGGMQHGFLVAGGPHPGDMPNIHVPDSGMLEIEVANTRVTLGESGDGVLLDADGSALMIHSGADDYTSQPSGEAGSRIACAEIPPR